MTNDQNPPFFWTAVEHTHAPTEVPFYKTKLRKLVNYNQYHRYLLIIVKVNIGKLEMDLLEKGSINFFGLPEIKTFASLWDGGSIFFPREEVNVSLHICSHVF